VLTVFLGMWFLSLILGLINHYLKYLSLGPVGLTIGTLSPAASTLIPTVTDNLFSAGTIINNLIGISFQPSNTTASLNGEISWGKIPRKSHYDFIYDLLTERSAI